MKKIMILGAGIYQVPLIKKAKEMNLYTIVVSVPGDYPGFEYADKVFYEDTTDYLKILELAKQEKINGICTTGTDVAVLTIGKVCDELGLKGVSESGAIIACDKKAMKKVYEEKGVNTAIFRYASITSNFLELKSICEDITYPVIFKACDSSGSRGITKVNDENDIKKAFDSVLSVTKQDEFLIESFIEGEEFGAQAFVQDGKLEFVLPHGDYVFKGNTGVPIGHFAPYETNMEDEIYEQTDMAIKAMKLDNCAINADFILKNGKVYVLELGARAGATNLTELVSIYYGYDYYEKILRVALAEKVSFAPKNAIRVPNASMLLRSNKSGVIVSQINNNKKNPNIYEIQFDFEPGHKVNKFSVGPDRIGHIVTKGLSLKEAVETLNLALTKVEIKVK